jgi:hypothetical protein
MPRDHTLERRTHVGPPAEPAPRPGVVVPFPSRAGRPVRRAPPSGEARGEVVLFLGVRYERLAS